MDISEGNLNKQKKLCSHEGVYFQWYFRKSHSFLFLSAGNALKKN